MNVVLPPSASVNEAAGHVEVCATISGVLPERDVVVTVFTSNISAFGMVL